MDKQTLTNIQPHLWYVPEMYWRMSRKEIFAVATITEHLLIIETSTSRFNAIKRLFPRE